MHFVTIKIYGHSCDCKGNSIDFSVKNGPQVAQVTNGGKFGGNLA